MKPTDTVTIFCDGACSISGSRARHGGWAAILVYQDVEKVISGHSYPETNQTMELQALIGGLQALKRRCHVEFWSDSQYLVKGVNEWLESWRRREWHTSENERVKNQSYWKEIERLKNIHDIHGNWVRGHTNRKGKNHVYNARCDELAVAEAWNSYRDLTGEKA